MKYKNLLVNFIYLKTLDKVYYTLSKPLLNDKKYDNFRKEFKEKVKKLKDSFLKKVILDYLNKNIGFVIPKSKKIKHKNKMYSLKKIYSLNDSSLHNLINIAIKNNFNIAIAPKVDGISAEIVDGRIISRGDGVYGNDISKCYDSIKWDSDLYKKGVHYGEIYLVKKNNEHNKNHRNIVAGIVNSKQIKEDHPQIAFFDFNYAFTKSLVVASTTFDRVLEYLKEEIEQFIELKEKSSYYTDGLVIKLQENKDSKCSPEELLGYTDKYPRFMLAYKFESEKEDTYLRNTLWDVGKTGKLTVIGELDPIEIQGSKISRVTLHNPNFIKENNLKIGSKVEISRRGDVIPSITKVYENDENCIDIKIPENCPVCNSILDNFVCKNPKCKGVLTRQMQANYKLTIKQSNDILETGLEIESLKDNIPLLEEKGWSKKKIQTILAKVYNGKK